MKKIESDIMSINVKVTSKKDLMDIKMAKKTQIYKSKETKF